MTTVEPPDGPPAPLRNMAPVGYLGTEERRIRLWEGAEREMGALRRCNNPVLEATRRAKTRWKKGKGSEVNGVYTQGRGPINGFGHSLHQGRDLVNSESRVSTATSSKTMDSATGSTASRRQGGADSRPVSRAELRSVRFEVGLDDGREGDQSEAVEDLLRRIWTGGESEAGEG